MIHKQSIYHALTINPDFFFSMKGHLLENMPSNYTPMYFLFTLNISLLLRSQRKTFCYSFFFLYIIFFLLGISKTPGRIFMTCSGMMYVGLEILKIIFRVMTSLPVRDIDDFLIFRVSFLFRDLLRNDSRYLLQIFTDDREMTEDCSFWVSSL